MLNTLRIMFSRYWWRSTILVSVGITITICLGIWQINRHVSRQATNNQIKTMQAEPHIKTIADDIPQNIENMEFRRIQVKGDFDYDHQIAIRNQAWNQEWGIEQGYTLLTPLILENGHAILVQRGWIPATYDSPASWREFDAPNQVTIEGIIRLPMTEGQMGGGVQDPTLEPGKRNNIWNFINIEQIQKQIPYPLIGIYIQQSPNRTKTTLPYPSYPELDLSNGTHLGYALQWFFFASLLIFGYPIYIKKQNIRKHNEINYQIPLEDIDD